MHHNLLGYSGTDGNAVWLHDNNFYDNSMGFSTDVFTAPGHPGFPQDSDLLEHNNFYDNNFNSYLPECPAGQKPGPSGPNQGCSDVTPTEPVPVGTGMWIAGGNANVVRNNRFYDNWRRGVMLFAVPDAFVCDDPDNQVAGCNPTPGTTPANSATSYRNKFFDNQMGQAPDGSPSPNGVDFWWDQGGIIVDTESRLHQRELLVQQHRLQRHRRERHRRPVSQRRSAPDNLPSSCENSPLPGACGKALSELYRAGNGDPSCPWFTTPPKP